MTETLTPRSLGGLQGKPVAQTSPTMSCLIFGTYGTGKTVLAASACEVPEMGEVYYINIEGGANPLRYHYPHIPVFQPRDANGNEVPWEWSMFGDIVDDVLDHPTSPDRPRTLIFDTLDEIQNVCIHDVMVDVVRENERERLRDSNIPKRNVENPSKREFGIVLKRMTLFMRYMRDLPHTNVIFVAHSKKSEHPKTKAVTIHPNFFGQFAEEGPSKLDGVFYLEMREGRKGEKPIRVLTTNASGLINAKSRSYQLNERREIEEPHMRDIFYLMTNTTPKS